MMTEREIFSRALDLTDPTERQGYLRGVCGDNVALQQRIEALLREHHSDDSLIARPGLEALVTLPSSQEPPAELGSVIGRYKLLQKIGEGGMGVVYMAEQREPVNRKVALKIIKLGMDTKHVVARFEAERQALAMMDHPSIARVLDGGATESGRPYFVMELVKGVPINEFCDKNKLSAPDRLRLFTQVCLAIQSAHHKGVIHRDIKPSNILVTLHHGEPLPKVIDFGIAKATSQRLTEKTLFTNYAQMIGTPAYMSPEQAEMSTMDVDSRTDVYSLGVLLYELLTGTTPFPEKELLSQGYGEMQRIIAEEEPERPSVRLSTLQGEQQAVIAKNRSEQLVALTKNLRGDLDWIVMKALEKDPTRRYDTAKGLSADIQRYLRDDPVEAVAPSFHYQLKKFYRRHKTAVSAFAGVVMALVLGTTIAVQQAISARQARDQAEEQRVRAEEATLQEAQLRESAEAKTREAQANLYAADVNLASRAVSEGNYGKAQRLLEPYGKDPALRDLAGWEWRLLWNRAKHSNAELELEGHEGHVSGVRFIDDHRLLTTSYDGTLRVWNLTTMESHSILVAPHARVRSVVVSSDGQYAAASWANFWKDAPLKRGITIWRVSDWEEIASFESTMGSNQERYFDFIPNTSDLLYVGPDMRPMRFRFEQRRSEPVADAKGDQLRVAGDGSFFVLFYGQSDEFSIHSLEGNEPPVKIPLQGRSAAVAISHDGSQIAIGYFYLKKIDLHRVDDGERIGTLEGHQAWISGLQFSHDDQRLFSASADQTIRIWNVPSQSLEKTLYGHPDEAWDLALSPQGDRLATGCKDGTVRLWPADGGQFDETPLWSVFSGLENVRNFNEGISGVNRAKNEVVYVMLDGSNRLIPRVLSVPGSPIHVAAVGARNTILTILLDEDTIWFAVWDATTQELIEKIPQALEGKSLEEFRQPPPSAVMKYFPTQATPSKSFPEFESIEYFRPRRRVYSEVANRYAAGYTSGRIAIYGEDGALIWETLAHGSSVMEVLFSHDGKELYTAGLDGYLRVWDVATLTQQGAGMRSQLLAIKSMTLSADGSRLVTAGNNSVTIWDAHSRRELATLSPQTPGSFTKVKFLTPEVLEVDGEQLELWHAPTWEELEDRFPELQIEQ